MSPEIVWLLQGIIKVAVATLTTWQTSRSGIATAIVALTTLSSYLSQAPDAPADEEIDTATSTGEPSAPAAPSAGAMQPPLPPAAQPAAAPSSATLPTPAAAAPAVLTYPVAYVPRVDMPDTTAGAADG
jgi:hypothetical protein